MQPHQPLLLLLGSVFLLVTVSGPAVFLVAQAHAGTTTGTAVTVSGLDALANTVDKYSKGNVGKMLGIGLGIGGMQLMGGGRLGLGGLAATAACEPPLCPTLSARRLMPRPPPRSWRTPPWHLCQPGGLQRSGCSIRGC